MIITTIINYKVLNVIKVIYNLRNKVYHIKIKSLNAYVYILKNTFINYYWSSKAQSYNIEQKVK